MARELHKRSDGSYTMLVEEDGRALALAHPPKFSLDDRLARFRYERMKAEWSAQRSSSP